VSSVTIDAEPRRIHLAGDGSLEDQSRPDLTLWLPRHGFENLVQRTFIHASVPPPTPPPHARPRSKSLPQIDNEIAPLKLDQVDLTESTIDSEQGSSRWNDPASDDQYESHLQSEADQFKIGDMVEIGAGEPTDFVEDKEPRQRCLFCPDEPLAIEEADSLQDFTTSAFGWSCRSPSLLSKDGCVGSISLAKVHNTFIHSPLAPPTPLRVSAARRSRSLPKNVGSDKNTWEATCQALGCGPGQISRDPKKESTLSLECGPTPSVYEGYSGLQIPCSLASSPAYVPTSPSPGLIPPSPALTASPTYYCPYNLAPRKLVLASATSSPSPKNQGRGLAPTGFPNPDSRVLHLASLI
jgi:hypothetical protein